MALIWPAAEYGVDGECEYYDDDEFDDYDDKVVEREGEGEETEVITSTSSCIPQSSVVAGTPDCPDYLSDADFESDQEFPSAQIQPYLYLSPPDSSLPHRTLSSPPSTYLPSAQPNDDLNFSMPSYPDLELASTWQEEYFEEESFFANPPATPPNDSQRIEGISQAGGEMDKVVRGMARVSMGTNKS